MHFEPIDVFRLGRVVDDFVGDLERQRGEEGEESEPRRRFLKPALCGEVFPCVENSRERAQPKK